MIAPSRALRSPSIFDLHTHSTASDGALDPASLVNAAIAQGVTTLAITDHDTVAGLSAARAAAGDSLRLISGVELTVRWRRVALHFIGLAFDPDNKNIAALIDSQQALRTDRARRIAHRLQRAVGVDLLADAKQLANGGVPGRAHFARALVARELVPDLRRAFRRYLGDGKTGDVGCEWVSLDDAVMTVKAAGGIGVLAHPTAYRFSKLKLDELVGEFSVLGGDAIEVISGHQSSDVTTQLTKLAAKYDLAASCGSDFHHPEQAFRQLGAVAPLPANLTPVWTLPAFNAA